MKRCVYHCVSSSILLFNGSLRPVPSSIDNIANREHIGLSLDSAMEWLEEWKTFGCREETEQPRMTVRWEGNPKKEMLPLLNALELSDLPAPLTEAEKQLQAVLRVGRGEDDESIAGKKAVTDADGLPFSVLTKLRLFFLQWSEEEQYRAVSQYLRLGSRYESECAAQDNKLRLLTAEHNAWTANSLQELLKGGAVSADGSYMQRTIERHSAEESRLRAKHWGDLKALQAQLRRFFEEFVDSSLIGAMNQSSEADGDRAREVIGGCCGHSESQLQRPFSILSERAGATSTHLGGEELRQWLEAPTHYQAAPTVPPMLFFILPLLSVPMMSFVLRPPALRSSSGVVFNISCTTHLAACLGRRGMGGGGGRVASSPSAHCSMDRARSQSVQSVVSSTSAAAHQNPFSKEFIENGTMYHLKCLGGGSRSSSALLLIASREEADELLQSLWVPELVLSNEAEDWKPVICGSYERSASDCLLHQRWSSRLWCAQLILLYTPSAADAMASAKAANEEMQSALKQSFAIMQEARIRFLSAAVLSKAALTEASPCVTEFKPMTEQMFVDSSTLQRVLLGQLFRYFSEQRGRQIAGGELIGSHVFTAHEGSPLQQPSPAQGSVQGEELYVHLFLPFAPALVKESMRSTKPSAPRKPGWGVKPLFGVARSTAPSPRTDGSLRSVYQRFCVNVTGSEGEAAQSDAVAPVPTLVRYISNILKSDCMISA